MSHHPHTCHSHLLHSFILQHSSPTIVWAHPASFYSDSYTHRLGLLISSQITLQRLYTPLRPISHVAESLRPLSHSPKFRLRSYHTSTTTPLSVLLVSVFRLQNPSDLSHCGRSVTSQSHVALRVWLFVLWCTALYRMTVSISADRSDMSHFFFASCLCLHNDGDS